MAVGPWDEPPSIPWPDPTVSISPSGNAVSASSNALLVVTSAPPAARMPCCDRKSSWAGKTSVGKTGRCNQNGGQMAV